MPHWRRVLQRLLDECSRSILPLVVVCCGCHNIMVGRVQTSSGGDHDALVVDSIETRSSVSTKTAAALTDSA
eukprot:6829259-Pyramimonas_sp.AAC.1